MRDPVLIRACLSYPNQGWNERMMLTETLTPLMVKPPIVTEGGITKDPDHFIELVPRSELWITPCPIGLVKPR